MGNLILIIKTDSKTCVKSNKFYKWQVDDRKNHLKIRHRSKYTFASTHRSHSSFLSIKKKKKTDINR